MSEEDREFVGYFMGEGCLTIHRANMKTTKGIRFNYAPAIVLSTRADDGEILNWIQKRFGGYIYKYPERIIKGYGNQPYQIRPVWLWRIQNREACIEIVDLLLQSKLPTKKKKEIELFAKFLEMKKRGHRQGFQGKWFTDEEIEEQEKVRIQLSSLKKYSNSV